VLEAGTATAQNRRDHMEDFPRVVHPFAGREDSLYAAVFDGHNGGAVARRASQELHGRLAVELEAGRAARAALPVVFHAFDESVAAVPCGAVAAVLVLEGASLTVANAGDSHVVVVTRGGAEVLTVDHRLTNEAEFRRVVAAGAQIRGAYVCLPEGSGLMCTRALGDRDYRQIGIIAEPDVATRTLGEEDRWIVAATDGVWDGLEPEDVGRLARAASTAKGAAAAIRDAALGASGDNIAVVAVRLHA